MLALQGKVSKTLSRSAASGEARPRAAEAVVDSNRKNRFHRLFNHNTSTAKSTSLVTIELARASTDREEARSDHITISRHEAVRHNRQTMSACREILALEIWLRRGIGSTSWFTIHLASLTLLPTISSHPGAISYTCPVRVAARVCRGSNDQHGPHTLQQP